PTTGTPSLPGSVGPKHARAAPHTTADDAHANRKTRQDDSRRPGAGLRVLMLLSLGADRRDLRSTTPLARRGRSLHQPFGLRAGHLVRLLTGIRFPARQTVAGMRIVQRVANRFANLLVRLVDVPLELADALPDRRPDLRHAPRAEQHEHDDQNDH